MRDRFRLGVQAFVILAVIASVVVGGCGGDDDEAPSSASGDGAQKTVQLSFILPTLDIEFIRRERDGMQRELERLGAAVDGKIEVGQGFDDVQGQLAMINVALTRGVDGLHVEPAAPDQLTTTLKRAADDGVALTTLGVVPGLENAATIIEADQYEGGKLAGTYLGEQLKPGDEVGIITCQPGFEVIDQRDQGATDAMKKAGLKVVAKLRGDCDTAKGLAATEDLLTAHANVKGIFFSNDPMALGGIRAVKNAGKAGDITLVGFDGSWEATDAIEAGTLDATVSQQAEETGAAAVQSLFRRATGENVPPRTGPDVVLVSEDNVSEYGRAAGAG